MLTARLAKQVQLNRKSCQVRYAISSYGYRAYSLAISEQHLHLNAQSDTESTANFC